PPIGNDDYYQLDDSYYQPGTGPFVVSADEGVLANDVGDGQHPLMAQLVQGPSAGVLTLLSDGSFEFQPDTSVPPPAQGYQFTYQAVMNGLVSLVTTVFLQNQKNLVGPQLTQVLLRG